jgi:molybdenum cofactor cytidylyltransferase
MGTDKAFLRFGGKTFLAGAIELLQSACDFVLVIAGDNAELLKPTIYEHSAFLVRNPEPQRGQFSSLQIGLQAVLDRGRDAACLTLVDRPPALNTTLRDLQQAFLASSAERIWAVVPQYGERHGHPVIFGREMIEVFLRAAPTAVARDLEHEHQNLIEYVMVNDSHVAVNINTPEDYSALCQKQ